MGVATGGGDGGDLSSLVQNYGGISPQKLRFLEKIFRIYTKNFSVRCFLTMLQRRRAGIRLPREAVDDISIISNSIHF